jgi:hypothetical protein
MPPVTHSDIATAQDGSFASRLDDKRKVEATILHATASITLVGDEAVNNVIALLTLPANAIVYPESCEVIAEDPGTTLTVNIGDSDDVNRYAEAIVLSAGGRVPFIAAGATAFPAGFTTRHKVTEATKNVTVTVASAATLTAGKKLFVKLAYACL